jgi:DNA repair exonuclease SbcCD ATPase subunit
MSNSQKSKMTILLSDIETLTTEISVYEIYKNIMNSKSLPKMLLSDTIKKVELHCNTFIYNLIGIYVNLNTIEDDDSKWEITFQKGDMILGSDHLSGFEKFVVNLGLKTSLDKYKFYKLGKNTSHIRLYKKTL